MHKKTIEKKQKCPFQSVYLLSKTYLFKNSCSITRKKFHKKNT